jgi:hypothetical protein
MNDLEKMIMKEISSLDELRLIDVLGFIRFLKEGKSETPKQIEKWFEETAKIIREQTKELIAQESQKNN